MTPEQELAEATLKLAKLIEHKLTRKRLSVDDDAHDLAEAKGEYYYELEPYKRWVLGDGGRAGNCDLCVENADEGWIPEESTWPNADDVPCHPNCTCEVERKERRVRYSYFDKD